MTLSLSINSNNDIFIAGGVLATVTGRDAVLQNCFTAMQSQRGEMMYAANNGMPYRATVWDQYSPELFEAAARSVLTNIYGVIGVLSFDSAINENTLAYVATIQTIYGTGIIASSSVSYSQTTQPGNILDYNLILDQSRIS